MIGRPPSTVGSQIASTVLQATGLDDTPAGRVSKHIRQSDVNSRYRVFRTGNLAQESERSLAENRVERDVD